MEFTSKDIGELIYIYTIMKALKINLDEKIISENEYKKQMLLQGENYYALISSIKERGNRNVRN